MNALERIRDIIQEDVGNRGLRADPEANLINACPDDFAAACRSIAQTPDAVVGVVTGFFIPSAQPPAFETDGPLGAEFLVRALTPLGIKVVVITDEYCIRAFVETTRRGCVAYVATSDRQRLTLDEASDMLELRGMMLPRMTHLIALERVGPNHTIASIQAQAEETGAPPGGLVDQFLGEVPLESRDRCHTMRGRDVTELMFPAHSLFEVAARCTPPITTIGIGDGGNEIGMGKIPWDTIRRNIPNGSLIACRVPTDHLIVAGISNWGAYGLAAGVRLLRGAPPDPELFDVERERELLRTMVEQGPLVDGVTGRQTVSVDGLDFERYAAVLPRLAEIK